MFNWLRKRKIQKEIPTTRIKKRNTIAPRREETKCACDGADPFLTGIIIGSMISTHHDNTPTVPDLKTEGLYEGGSSGGGGAERTWDSSESSSSSDSGSCSSDSGSSSCGGGD